MARRTKEDAAETRSRLLDAAELLFHEKGVSRTSLNDIALAAGATRGAIYWHFQDKADLFNAMMERVTLPLESSLCRAGTQASADPLEGVCGGMLHALRCAAAQVDADGRMRLRRGGGSDGDAEALIGDLMRRRSLTPPETAPPPPGTAP